VLRVDDWWATEAEIRELLPPIKKVRPDHTARPEVLERFRLANGWKFLGDGDSRRRMVLPPVADPMDDCTWISSSWETGPSPGEFKNSKSVCLFMGRAPTFLYAQLLELYLVYLINQEGENGSLKNLDLYDQKTAPLTPNSFIYNRYPFSQAGRRGFEPRLPLHLFSNLAKIFQRG
jgi:hypothetical protein